ncbi:hypothetical protein Droror1_Dr00027258, partial [Drosera rotundifolia]
MLSNAQLPTNVLHRGIRSQRRLHPVSLVVPPTNFNQNPNNPDLFRPQNQHCRNPSYSPSSHNSHLLIPAASNSKEKGSRSQTETEPPLNFDHIPTTTSNSHCANRVSNCLGIKIVNLELWSLSVRTGVLIAGNVDEDGKTIMEKGLRVSEEKDDNVEVDAVGKVAEVAELDDDIKVIK